MNGHKLVAGERAKRRDRWWRGRRADAADERSIAHTEWDRTRANIGRLPEGEQAAAWRQLASAVEQVGCQFDTRESRRRVAQGTAARTRTRGAEPNTSRKERVR